MADSATGTLGHRMGWELTMTTCLTEGGRPLSRKCSLSKLVMHGEQKAFEGGPQKVKSVFHGHGVQSMRPSSFRSPSRRFDGFERKGVHAGPHAGSVPLTQCCMQGSRW